MSSDRAAVSTTFFLFVSGARNADLLEVRQDEEISPFSGFKVVPVVLHVKLWCIANNLRDSTVALGKFHGNELSFSSFVVKSLLIVSAPWSSASSADKLWLHQLHPELSALASVEHVRQDFH